MLFIDLSKHYVYSSVFCNFGLFNADFGDKKHYLTIPNKGQLRWLEHHWNHENMF